MAEAPDLLTTRDIVHDATGMEALQRMTLQRTCNRRL
jgi:hypothetical protein